MSHDLIMLLLIAAFAGLCWVYDLWKERNELRANIARRDALYQERLDLLANRKK